jgi:hypothetical protein
MDTCPFPLTAKFTGTTVYLGPDANGVSWSHGVALHAYCGDVDDSNHWLSNVLVTGVFADSNGTIKDLEGSADGVNWTTLPPQGSDPDQPFPNVLLSMPANLMTDTAGNVGFTLYARSLSQPFLAGPDGAPRLIGMQLDKARGTATDASGAMTLTYKVGGFGDVIAATPELDSLVLFGTGAAGLAGYALMRMRARGRRH